MTVTTHLQSLIDTAEDAVHKTELHQRVGGDGGLMQTILAVLAQLSTLQGTGNTSLSQLATQACTVTGTEITASGNIAAGAHSHVIVFSSDFTGTIAGLAYDGANDASITLAAPFKDTLPAIAVVVTTGSLRVTSVSP